MNAHRNETAIRKIFLVKILLVCLDLSPKHHWQFGILHVVVLVGQPYKITTVDGAQIVTSVAANVLVLPSYGYCPPTPNQMDSSSTSLIAKNPVVFV